MSKQVNNNSRVGALGLLGVLFVGLKLTDIIDWSWWWVTLPFWGPALAVIVLASLAVAYSVHNSMKK